MKKRILAVFLILSMLLSLLSIIPVYGQEGSQSTDTAVTDYEQQGADGDNNVQLSKNGTTMSTGNLLIAVNTNHNTGSSVSGSFSEEEYSLQQEEQQPSEVGEEVYAIEDGGQMIQLAPDVPEAENLFSGPAILTSLSGEQSSHAVGETFNLTSSYSPTGDGEISMQCLYIGQHCTVWGSAIGEEATAIQLSQANATTIGQTFDLKYDDMTGYFGNTWADVDGDGKVAIMCYDIDCGEGDTYSSGKTGYFSGSYVGGFFSIADLVSPYSSTYSALTVGQYTWGFPASWVSNQLDCIHIDTFPSMGGSYSKPYGNLSKAYSTLFHEYQHMMNLSTAIASGAEARSPTFLNEAFSMAAEHLIFGSSYTSSRVSYFNTQGNYDPGTSLTYWGQTLSDYALSYLFGQYIRTQYAQQTGTDGSSIYGEILRNAGNVETDTEYLSIIADLLCTTENELVKDFWLACYLKEPTGPHGFYGESWANGISPQLSSSSSKSDIGSGGAKYYNTTTQKLNISNSRYLSFATVGTNGMAEGYYRLTLSSGYKAIDTNGRVYLNGAAVKNGTTLTTVLDGISIDATSFPDANFRSYVTANIDTDSNNVLSKAEQNAVTAINCSGGQIADLTGIELFSNLTNLNCSNNQLKRLDIGSNTALITLDCSGNALAYLDLSDNINLQTVSCASQCIDNDIAAAADGSVALYMSTLYPISYYSGIGSDFRVTTNGNNADSRTVSFNRTTGMLTVPAGTYAPEYLCYTYTVDEARGYSFDVKIKIYPEVEYSYSVTNEKATVTGVTYLSDTVTALTVPDMLGGYPVTQIGTRALSNTQNITSVTLPSTLLTIEEEAFKDCQSLTEVFLPQGLQTIGARAFAGTALMQLTLPQSVTTINTKAIGFDSNLTVQSNFTLYATAGSAAASYATANGLTLVTLNQQTDAQSGISAEVQPGLTLTVASVTEGSYFVTAVTAAGQLSQQIMPTATQQQTKVTLYEISLQNSDQVTVQPDNNLCVSIPVPTGYSADGCHIYRINDDGTVEDMHATVVDDKLVFVTPHLSYYAVIELPVVQDITGIMSFQCNKQLSLGNDLKMTYKIRVTDYENPYMVFTLQDSEQTIVTEYTVDGSGRYCFDYKGIMPQRMNDTISAVVYMQKDGRNYSYHFADYSVRLYCEYILENYFTTYGTLVYNLLYYGEQAQIYTDYRTDALVTEGLNIQPADHAEDVSKVSTINQTDRVAGGIEIVSKSLVLNNAVGTRVFFTLEQGVSIDDVTFKLELKNGTTLVRTTTLDKDDFVYDSARSRYYFDYRGILSTEFDYELICTSYVNGVLDDVMHYSVNTYLVTFYENLDIVKAVFDYGCECRKFA